MASDVRPKLVVAYCRQSIPPFVIAEAAQGLCDLIWVLDFTDPLLAWALPLVKRLGTAVDAAGRCNAEIAVEVARQHPDGVITFSSEPIPLAEAIARESHLRFHSPYAAELLTNKHSQRVALAQAGVRGPRFWPVPEGAAHSERARLAAELSYPVVLKPQLGSGSRSTYRVEDAASLLLLLGDAQAAGEDMLIEELLTEAHSRARQRFGDVLMVDSVAAHGRVNHFAVAGHFVPAEPFRGTGSFIPAQLSADETAEVLAATDAALKVIGIEDGFTNTDLILTPEGPCVLEVNGRIGGQIPTLLQLLGAPSLLREAMKFALRESDGDVAAPEGDRVSFCAMYQPPTAARRLLQLDGLDVVARLPGVTHVVPYRRVGDGIDWRRGTISRLLTVYGVVDDHDQLHELYEMIQQKVIARYEMSEPPTPAAPGS